jgi:hypothetical protein
MAKVIHEATIADVHLTLFGYWIRQMALAKKIIRELSLDGWVPFGATAHHPPSLQPDLRSRSQHPGA